MQTRSPTREDSAIDRNIAEVHKVRRNSDENRRADEKFVDQVASFLGTTRALYVHLLFYGALVTLHLIANTSVDHLYIATAQSIGLFATLEALFLALFVLINQRRTSGIDRKNSDLHLQTTLLAEHELTRVAQILDLIAKNLKVDISSVEGLEQLKDEVHPDTVLERISDHEKKVSD